MSLPAAEDDVSPGIVALRAAVGRLGIDLPALVAEVGLWVTPAAHAARVTAANPTGAVRQDIRRARSDERSGTVVNGVRLDLNNYAGQALRAALQVPRRDLLGYYACHVWPETCYDERYHTVLANLVLIPAPLASLTDHDPDVIAALKYHSFELYGWHPLEEAPPTRPTQYPTNWRAPLSGASNAAGGRRGKQRAAMRQLWAQHGGDERAVVQAWAEAVRAGTITRDSNVRGQSAEEYAKRLISDGKKKGWLS